MNLSFKKLKEDKSNLNNLYQEGFLPQRKDPETFYKNSNQPSSRSDLSFKNISSENRRILKHTDGFQYRLLPLVNLNYDHRLQKTLKNMAKDMDWDIKTASIKTIFTGHIFNHVYVWKLKEEVVAYALIHQAVDFSHIAYVFYSPQENLKNLPVRMVLQTVIDSQKKGHKYCYLGTFSQDRGYYKRNMPSFEYYSPTDWISYEKNKS